MQYFSTSSSRRREGKAMKDAKKKKKKPETSIAYGAVIGGWFGAWPMPLDWKRPWQEWYICVCYGAIGGYIVGQIVSFSLMFFSQETQEFEASLE